MSMYEPFISKPKDQQIDTQQCFQKYLFQNKTNIFQHVYNSSSQTMRLVQKQNQRQVKKQVNIFKSLHKKGLCNQFLRLWKQKPLLAFFVLNNNDFKEKKKCIINQLLQIIDRSYPKTKYQSKQLNVLSDNLTQEIQMTSISNLKQKQKNRMERQNDQKDIYHVCLKWMIQNDITKNLQKLIAQEKAKKQKYEKGQQESKSQVLLMIIAVMILLILYESWTQ